MSQSAEIQEIQIGELQFALESAERRLLAKKLEFDALLQITDGVNSNYSVTELFNLYNWVLTFQLSVGRVAVFIHEGEWQCKSCIGYDQSLFTRQMLRELTQIRETTAVDHEELPHFHEFDIIVPVYHKEQPLAYAVLSEMRNFDTEEEEEKLTFIQALTNIVAVAIENKRLFRSQVQQEFEQRELDLAAEMQGMLMPSNLPDNDYIQVAGFYQAHRQIGGDYYDYIEINDHEVAFCIADVSGKGVAAGFLMANFQANLRMLINKEYPLDQLVDFLNHRVYEITKGEKYITFFIGIFNRDSRKLSFVNAGHTPSILFDGTRTELLDTGCTILGVFDELPATEIGEVFVEENAMILNYTDGIIDIENEKGKMYGIENLISSFEKGYESSPQELADRLLNDIDLFKGTAEYPDDISMLVCRFK